MKKICFYLGIIIILSSSWTVNSEDDIFIPHFTKEDCQCPDIGMNLTSDSYQNNMFGSVFKKSNEMNSPLLRHELWYYSSSSYTSEKFTYYLDPTIGVRNLGYEQEHVTEYISEGKDYEIIEEKIEDTYASFSWKDSSDYFNGKRAFILYDMYLCRMTAEHFTSESDVLDAMNTLEQCIRNVVTEKHTGYIPKEEITFTSSLLLNDHPLPYLDISLIAEGKEYETVTDKNGNYSITCEQSEDNSYTLLISFSYLRDSQCFYQLHFQHEKNPIALELTINDDEITKVRFIVGGSIGSFTKEASFGNVSDVTIQDFIDVWPEVQDYAGLYLHFSEVVSFYVDHLGESLDFQLPVEVYTCIEGGPRYLYNGGKSWISIDSERTGYETEYRPKSREFHEFSHYVMHALYEGNFPKSPSDLGKEVNHGGYDNPTTADSYVEGFAEFMSVVIGEYYNNYWENLEEKRCGGASSCPPFGSLEPNFKAWEIEGKAEEWAVAGVLWDLYDGPEQIQKDKEFLQRAYRYVAENTLFNHYDANHDNTLQRNEQIIYLILDKYDCGDIESVYVLEPDEITKLIADLFVGIRNNGVDALSDSQYEYYRGIVQFEVYDQNKDGVVADDEWDFFIQEQFNFSGYDNDYYKKIFQYAYDKNEDLSMNESELVRLLAGEEIRQNWNSSYDKNGNENYTIEELVSMADVFEELIKELSTVMNDVFNLLPDIWNLDSVLDSINETTYVDDDAIDLSLEQMWPILKTFHNDFTAVYISFISTFPAQKEGIDEIFKNHGFFADIKPENHQWDEGEEIGRAANASTNKRQERRSSEPFPGSYLKVDNTIPFYYIQIQLFNDSYSISDPIAAYAINSRNENGMIYIPIPPEQYRAHILIEADGVETKNPLTLTSSQIYAKYEESLDQGYITSYDFETVGTIPSTANRFYSDVEWDENGNEQSQQTPGFISIEILFTLILMILVFFIKKQNKSF